MRRASKSLRVIGPNWSSKRRLVLLAVAVLLVPTVVAGLTHAIDGAEDRGEGSFDDSVENLTIVASQGRSPDVVRSPGGIEIVNTTSKEQVWSHGDDRCRRYYDAEPIDESTVLFSADCRVDGTYHRFAFEYDWRTETTERLFRIPTETHDLDRIDARTYVIGDFWGQRAYVYDYTDDAPMASISFDGHEVRDATDGADAWEFDFTDRYPPSAGGPEDYSGDYTHLNDVDPVDGGEAFLLSPRDFNRVMLVNRSTGNVVWTLGEQDDTSILAGQHHPVLLSQDPPTVLVGDSNNHRVVEYRRVDGEWERTWSYSEGLNWPRSVARLPDGNTLIMDTGNDRALEVTPNGTVVWEYETTFPNPYNVVRYRYGDEPDGPTMAAVQGDDATAPGGTVGSVSPLAYGHRIAGYVLPPWVGRFEFATLVGAAVLALGWGATEAGAAIRRRV